MTNEWHSRALLMRTLAACSVAMTIGCVADVPSSPTLTAGNEVSPARPLNPAYRALPTGLKMKALAERSRAARGAAKPTETIIRSYDRDGNVTRELVWGDEGKLISRPSSLPPTLNVRPGSRLASPTGSILMYPGTVETLAFTATLDDSTAASVVDSLWTDTSGGTQTLVATADEPRATSTAEIFYSTASNAGNLSLSSSAVIFAPAPGTYDEVIEWNIAPDDWAQVMSAVHSDTTTGGFLRAATQREGDVMTLVNHPGPRHELAFALLMQKADPCALEGQLMLLGMGRAAVYQGIAVATATFPIANVVAEARAVSAIREAAGLTGIYLLCRWNHRNDP